MFGDVEVVSVVVVTYNSASTVIETLDSIKLQDYGTKNIDLIVTDDASRDDTVQVINSWIDANSDLFNSARLLIHEHNGGIAKNCNHGWRAANTNWIKTIAGDDLLSENCISALVEFVAGLDVVPECIFSKVRCFGRKNSVIPYDDISQLIKCSPHEQFLHLLVGNFLPAPASFLNKRALEKVGYANESYRLIEDYPLWLNMVANGQQLGFLDMELVKYRVSNSITSQQSYLINQSYEEELARAYVEIIDTHSPQMLIAQILKIDKIIQQRLRCFFAIRIFKNKFSKKYFFILHLIGCFSLSSILEKMRRSKVKFLMGFYIFIFKRFSLCLSGGE